MRTPSLKADDLLVFFGILLDVTDPLGELLEIVFVIGILLLQFFGLFSISTGTRSLLETDLVVAWALFVVGP